ncbi:hypothetical protein GCM10018952_18000 [Streptosporangium vulgare]
MPWVDWAAGCEDALPPPRRELAREGRASPKAPGVGAAKVTVFCSASEAAVGAGFGWTGATRSERPEGSEAEATAGSGAGLAGGAGGRCGVARDGWGLVGSGACTVTASGSAFWSPCSTGRLAPIRAAKDPPKPPSSAWSRVQ